MRLFISALLLVSCFSCAFADGGRLRLSQTAGPFLITLFTTPEPLTPGPCDFSVMVQYAKSGDIISDSHITIDLTSAQHADQAIHAIASQGIATNRLLQAAQITLPVSGAWELHLVVHQGAQMAALDLPIIVEPRSRRTPLVWTFTGLPVLAILLFVLHQRQKALFARQMMKRDSA